MVSRLKVVNDKMQRGYHYALTAPMGRNFDPEFRPELTPQEMLALGVFCGKYMTDCRKEFPARWFARAKLSPSGLDAAVFELKLVLKLDDALFHVAILLQFATQQTQ
jgi:hypothetical protein